VHGRASPATSADKTAVTGMINRRKARNIAIRLYPAGVVGAGKTVTLAKP
jgi:hypothetical protein